jgi:hypothetical protein
MANISSRNSIKNLNRYRIRTLTYLIKSRDIFNEVKEVIWFLVLIKLKYRKLLIKIEDR